MKKIIDLSNPEKLSKIDATIVSRDVIGSSSFENKQELHDLIISGNQSLSEKLERKYGAKRFSTVGDQANLYFKDEYHCLCALLESIEFKRKLEEKNEDKELRKLLDGKKYQLSCGIYTCDNFWEFGTVGQQRGIQLATEIGKTHIVVEDRKFLNDKILFGSKNEITGENFIQKTSEQLNLLQENYIVDYNSKKIRELPQGLAEKVTELYNLGIEDISLKRCSPGKETEKIINLIKSKKTLQFFYAAMYVDHIIKKSQDKKENMGDKNMGDILSLTQKSEDVDELLSCLNENDLKIIDSLAGITYHSNLFGEYWQEKNKEKYRVFPFAKSIGMGTYKLGKIPTYQVFTSSKEIWEGALKKIMTHKNFEKEYNILINEIEGGEKEQK